MKSLKLILLVCVVVLLGSQIVSDARSKNLTLDHHHIDLEVAKTRLAREKGLGGRANLPVNYGLLFVFDRPDYYCFWMKGTRFDLDIIWLDGAKQIISTETNVSPATYPQNFCPPSLARYVIEFPAGQASALDLVNGRRLSF